MRSYEDKATIKVPAIARVRKQQSATSTVVSTGNLFSVGDPVTIALGYDNKLQTEFEGFVKRKELGMPMVIECEGYVQRLRETHLTENLSKGIPVKKLLEIICTGTGITVDCQVDFTMYGRNFNNADGTKVLDEIKKCSDNALSIFFIEPRKLWCGYVFTPTINGEKVFGEADVKYRLGWNCIKDNGLKEHKPASEAQVYYNGTLASGDAVRTASDEKVAKRKIKAALNGVRDVNVIKAFVNEKAKRMNYVGYEGTLTAFLQPFCKTGYTAFIKDDRYPERDGRYLVESVHVSFGMSGARRKVEIGTKLGDKK